MSEFIILSISGIVAGFVNGFFGTGGGLVIFFALTYLGCDTRRSLATANSGILVLSLVSLLFYIEAGALSTSDVVEFCKKDLGLAFVGGFLGAWLSGRISPKILKKLFSALIIFCGIKKVMG